PPDEPSEKRDPQGSRWTVGRPFLCLEFRDSENTTGDVGASGARNAGSNNYQVASFAEYGCPGARSRTPTFKVGNGRDEMAGGHGRTPGLCCHQSIPKGAGTHSYSCQ